MGKSLHAATILTQSTNNDPIEDRIDFFTFIAFVDRDGMYQQVASSQHADKGFGCRLRCLHRLRAGRKIVKHNRLTTVKMADLSSWVLWNVCDAEVALLLLGEGVRCRHCRRG